MATHRRTGRIAQPEKAARWLGRPRLVVRPPKSSPACDGGTTVDYRGCGLPVARKRVGAAGEWDRTPTPPSPQQPQQHDHPTCEPVPLHRKSPPPPDRASFANQATVNPSPLDPGPNPIRPRPVARTLTIWSSQPPASFPSIRRDHRGGHLLPGWGSGRMGSHANCRHHPSNNHHSTITSPSGKARPASPAAVNQGRGESRPSPPDRAGGAKGLPLSNPPYTVCPQGIA